MNKNINLYALKGSNGTNYIMPYTLGEIHNLKIFMESVIYGQGSMSSVSTNKRYARERKKTMLHDHMRCLPEFIQLYSKDYHFSPLLDFFFEQYRIHPIRDCLTLDVFVQEDIDIFNNFILTMRLHAAEVKLKKKVADWVSKSTKNQKSLMEFEAKLFKKHGRLMVIRLDFNYHKAEFSPVEIEALLKHNAALKQRDLSDYWAGDDLSKKRVMDGRIALEEVQRDRKHLFANMKGKPSLFEHLVGYVWRIEFGREAGYHLHAMFFYDGSHVQKHEYLAHEIGEYWREVITKRRSYFECCNRNKSKYGGSWALGTINHWEVTRRNNLKTAMQYFCKTNQVVQVVPYPGCRLFGTGFARRDRGHGIQGGRPRTRGVPPVPNHISPS
jgi:hypothetical protein